MRGVWTAMITPFTKDGEIDLGAFRKILRMQADAGVAGVIPCGTTGESPTLSLEEKKLLIRTCLQELKGSKIGVVAGTGSNQTQETIEFSRWAAGEGVEGVLVVTPYYNKPSQAGLEAHFLAVASAVKCNVILYNVPGRSGVSLSAETVSRLASHPQIRALKEATGNPAFSSEILEHLHRAGQSLDILSGDDATYLPLLSIGAQGVISVASNLFPREMVQLQTAFDSGDLQQAQKIHRQYYPLFRDLFIESNPVPIKAALATQGWCTATVRAPLVGLQESSRRMLEKSLRSCGFTGEKP